MRPILLRPLRRAIPAALFVLTAINLPGCEATSRERYYRAQRASFAPLADVPPLAVRTASAEPQPR